MNRRLMDQFQALALPELLEDSLEEGVALCIAFNRRGTLLAAGLQDGRVVLWDFDTRGVARSCQPHIAPLTSLAWSRDGRLLVSSAADGSAVLWNVETNTQEGQMTLGQHILHLSMNRQDPRLCLASFPGIAPTLLDFQEERSQSLPCLQLDAESKGGRPVSSGLHEGISAIFNRSGNLVYMALARGFVAVLDRTTLRFVDLIKVPGSARAVNMTLSKNGKHLLINYQDKVIRAFEVSGDTVAGRKSFSLPELRAHLSTLELPSEGSVLSPGQPLLKLASHNFQNAVDRNNWQCAAFTCDVEHVAAASACKDAHHLHIWTRWGRLERILEGPNYSVRDLAWHPLRPLLASVSATGAIYLWARVYRENWSAFAPDFRELQENEEYVEPEDVFDINPRQKERKDSGAAANGQADADMDDAEIDIVTEDEIRVYSSDDEPGATFLHHLPVEIIPQEFDERGQLVKREERVDSESPAPSSLPDSEPQISEGGIDSRRLPAAAAADGKHRLAVSSRADEELGARLRPARQKRYLDDVDEDVFEDDFGGTAAMREY